jgi:5'-nucleotidase
VIHSGTVGAALTALGVGLPAIAVSLAWGENERWDTAAVLAAAALPAVARLRGQALNLSVPNVALEDVEGVRAARLAEFAERWTAEVTPDELQLHYDGHAREPEPDTDVALVRAGYAAVTALGRVPGTPAVDAAETIAASTAARLPR